MGKTIKINEQQLATLVNYIKENEKPLVIKEEVLEEGKLANWLATGLLTLASMAGMSQEKLDINNQQELNNAIEAAEDFKEKLSDENSDEYKLFTQATKDMNAQNIEKIKNVDPKDGKVIKTFKTQYTGTAASKVKQGGMITDIVITTDTVWGDLPEPLQMDSTIETNLEGNLFKSGAFELNEDVAEELSTQFQLIKDSNSELTHLTIHASTDKEPLTDDLEQILIDGGYSGDNEGLAHARKDGVYNYLTKVLKIDSSLIKLDIKWEQGPDVYSPDMSDVERQAAKDLPGTTAARNVGVSWGTTTTMQGDDTEPTYKLIKKKMIEVTSLENPLKGGKISTRTGGEKTKKMEIPKFKMDGKELKCELFGQKRK
jgi:hypothetical protein